MEGMPKFERKAANALEAGAFGVALLAALDASPAKALEIDPSTSWQQGIERNLHQSVQEDKEEHAVVYVQFKDGSGTWLAPEKGTAKQAAFIPVEIERKASSFGKPVEKICFLHTHPMEVPRQLAVGKNIPDIEVISSPPSAGDIVAGSTVPSLQKNAYSFTWGVADNRGVWYFAGTQSSEEKAKSASSVLANKAYNAFVNESLEPTFNFAAELPKLQHAYKEHLGGELRFVPYDQVGKEAPCAGVQPTASTEAQTQNPQSTEAISPNGVEARPVGKVEPAPLRNY